MPVAQGACPQCGAPIEFSVGASVSKVCPYCRHVVLRTDRDLRNLGRAADLANTPSVVSVGDRGVIRGRAFEVVGRVQLDYGRGPWDEFYVAFADGAWGWLTEAQGSVYAMQLAPEPIAVPPAPALQLDQPVTLGRYGVFRVAERRTAKVLTAEGELPFRPAPERLYADLHGPNEGFATLDYGDGTRPPEVFVGARVPLGEVQLTPRGGERPGAQAVQLAAVTCPNCGAALPPPSDKAIERVACRYCNAISELASMRVIARQAVAYAAPKIPLGSKGNLGGTEYTVIGFVRRGAVIEGEAFSWSEYLLYSRQVGFRWLVEDEGNWSFVRPVSSAEVAPAGRAVRWHNRTFSMRNDNQARVEYVVGEFYWKVEVGETVHATDYVAGADVLSREEGDGEVNWSYGAPVDFAQIARAFGLPPPPPSFGGFGGAAAGGGGGRNVGVIATVVIIILVLCCVCAIGMSSGGTGTSGGYYGGGGSYSGGGYSGGGYSGGSGGFGGFGGK